MMLNGTVSQESAAKAETGPESDEPIYFTPHRQRIIRAGECARLEQQRLEKQLGLENGRTPRPD
jgi:hypothetical protein